MKRLLMPDSPLVSQPLLCACMLAGMVAGGSMGVGWDGVGAWEGPECCSSRPLMLAGAEVPNSFFLDHTI
jgi:hypothetical protein